MSGRADGTAAAGALAHGRRTVRTPTLIIHGEKDRCVPAGQAYEMYAGIARLGDVPVELVVYPREGHSIGERAHRVDYWRRCKAWFDRYVARPDDTG